MNAALTFSRHALEQFGKRWRYAHPKAPMPPSLEVTARKLMVGSKREELSPGETARRIINNGFKQADYFVNSGWRFVVVDGTVVTIERTKPWQN